MGDGGLGGGELDGGTLGGGARPVRRLSVGRGSRAVELGGPTRIIVPLTGEDVDELRAQCRALRGHPVDLVEWRVDQLAAVRGVGAGAGEAADAGPLGAAGTTGENLRPVARQVVEEALAVVCEEAGLPVLATVRTVHEGGDADLGDAGYAELVDLLARAGADAVDVEYRRGDAAGIIGRAHRAGVVVIASNHDFSATPAEEEVIARLVAMRDLGADVAKVAYRERTPWDMFPVLNAQMWARDHLGIPVIAISMGPAGALSRIGGEHLGSAATFATVGQGSAPGQFSADAVAEALDHMRLP